MTTATTLVLCALCLAAGVGLGWGAATRAALARQAVLEVYLSVVEAGFTEYAAVERLLERALPRLSSRLVLLPSSHDLEVEARFVDDVREALDRLHARKPTRASTPVPVAAVSEPVILLKEDA
jgi:hypothetical protein